MRGRHENAHRIVVGRPKWKGRFEDPGLSWRIKWKWISEKRTPIGVDCIHERDSCGCECRHLDVIRSGDFFHSWPAVGSCNGSSVLRSQCHCCFRAIHITGTMMPQVGRSPQVLWIWGRRIEWDSTICQTFQLQVDNTKHLTLLIETES